MIYYHIVSVLLFFMVVQCAFAKDQIKPEWTNGYLGEENDASYIEVISAEGSGKEDAYSKAINKLIEWRSLVTLTDAKVERGGDTLRVTSSNSLILSSHIIAEYYEMADKDVCRCYLLVQTAKVPTGKFDYAYLTEKYKFSARVFVPGMAQIYKGSVGKGIGFIVGEIVCIGGVIAAECLRIDYINKINSTHNISLRQAYTQNANTCALARNICIGGAVAVYAWNVIDGIAAKGKPHIRYEDTSMYFAPYTDMESLGLAIKCTF